MSSIEKAVSFEGHSCDLLDPSISIPFDEADELKGFRDRFLFPQHDGKDCTYLCGNSLGLQPKALKEQLNNFLDKWQNQAVEGHFMEPYPWLDVEYPMLENLSTLVGALPSEVVPMNSLTVNLHFMMAHFYQPNQTRFKILIEDGAFSSDNFAVESQVRFHGLKPEDAIVKVRPRPGEFSLRTDDIIDVIKKEGESLALVLLSGVQFYSGQYFQIEPITLAGQSVGAFVGWDLAHAVGNVTMKLHDWNVDFACWCSYKYLNSGPGAISVIFVHQKHTTPNKDSPKSEDWWSPRLVGWFGHNVKSRFATNILFEPAEGAMGFRNSNPSILCITSLRTSLNIFAEARVERLRQKSIKLTAFMEHLIEKNIDKADITIITPKDITQRGCQLSLLVSDTKIKATKDKSIGSIVQSKLLEQGVYCDAREPNVLRVAPTPLYNTFNDVRVFVLSLKKILDG
eukprot:TRINITY_DN777_c0_g1_i1.p1 TRINITY_DN777_c0_g1~~TRINITY_DN777_c0_g1_i1.p1  ORF type:complete len:455 (-),score=77.58 TRINITY_DN777_c0_g1_i1:44-1408(-)